MEKKNIRIRNFNGLIDDRIKQSFLKNIYIYIFIYYILFK